MQWRLAGPEAEDAVSAWVASEEPNADLESHVVAWLLGLGEVGPHRVRGVRLFSDEDRFSIIVQATMIQVDFVASPETGDIRIGRIQSRARRR